MNNITNISELKVGNKYRLEFPNNKKKLNYMVVLVKKDQAILPNDPILYLNFQPSVTPFDDTGIFLVAYKRNTGVLASKIKVYPTLDFDVEVLTKFNKEETNV